MFANGGYDFLVELRYINSWGALVEGVHDNAHKQVINFIEKSLDLVLWPAFVQK